MKNLEQHQREMRERNLAPNNPNEASVAATPHKLCEDSTDDATLRKKIAELENRILALEAENQRLRAQKTIVVERPVPKSYGDTVREQRHNFFKYSNARRY